MDSGADMNSKQETAQSNHYVRYFPYIAFRKSNEIFQTTISFIS